MLMLSMKHEIRPMDGWQKLLEVLVWMSTKFLIY